MPTVLIADGATESRENLKALLRMEATIDIDVVGEAQDGQEALEMVRSTKPDILILDANIPRIDALEVTDRVTPATAVIIICSHYDESMRRKYRTAGAFEFLVKPVRREELIESINGAYRWLQKERSMMSHVGGEAAKQGRIITLYSPKGGAGSTILAANLAVAMALHHSGLVALVDLSLQFGNIDMLLNLSAEHSIAGLSQRQSELDMDVLERFLITHEESNLRVLVAPSTPQYAEMVTVYLVEQVLSLLKANYDYVIVDTSTVLQDTTLAALDNSDLILLITTLDLLALHNTKTALDMLKQLYPAEKIKVVLNRSDTRMGLTPRDVEEALTCTLYAQIPSDGKVAVTSANDGEPFVMRYPQSEISRAVMLLAYQIMGKNTSIIEYQSSLQTKPLTRRFLDFLLGSVLIL